MKKKVYIISHSHWDREWYMAYEQHHMRLVQLMDDLLDLIEHDPEFHSFHLDGQTIILDDYLQVRPERKAAVQRAIASGKLQIGPFYILQDDFLISSESNARNMLIGMEESKKWGTPVMLGYFPDTFGNMGQTPQMMKQANLAAAAFGRGVKPIGFDNEVLEDRYTSQYSEMNWQGPDGTEIFGLLFANWYSNGNEIPAEETAAKAFWDQKLADAEKYASTDHLLMMNGVDHQPVQKDISKAITLANKLYPNYEFVHSSFAEYLEAVQADLPEEIGQVTGELTSQETDGWFTLANTSSARVYLKQWNTKVSRQLENITEPLASMAFEVTGEYPHDQLDYAWKTLMQNHPHDSICGCSVDEVHREMLPRFEKANEVGKYLAEEAAEQLVSTIDTSEFPEGSYPFIVFNTASAAKSGTAQVDLELKRITFQEQYPSDGYETLAQEAKKQYHVINQSGQTIPAVISEERIRFDYDLPKDRFRIPYMEKYVTVTIDVKDLPPFSWESFSLVEGAVDAMEGSLIKEEGRVLENGQVKVTIAGDGSISLTDKELGRTVNNLLIFEDVGDIANEYIFKQPENDQAILSTSFDHRVEVLEDTPLTGKIRLVHELKIPQAAEDLLALEQQMVVDFRKRKAQRSEKRISFILTTEITLDNHNRRVNFETRVNNQAKDHRLRVLFPTMITADTHEADSIYETVVRPTKPSKHWENPANPQHQHAFVNLHNQQYGLTVSNFGLNEYEIIDDTIALTLLRSVGEMGDWGYFPTPEAQCLGEHTFSFGVELHGDPASRYQTYKQAHSAQVPLTTRQTNVHSGLLKAKYNYLVLEEDRFEVTTLKRRKEDEALILRGYNLSDQATDLFVEKAGQAPTYQLNLLEERCGEFEATLQPYEIKTLEMKE
ncbi:alpha-mannosidase [Candidatus Enterococcus ferrettii]|uniref:Alpha-mannosidase n=1 Tax=Candidatus Enterococcus ferrettii TaxID=2815324 RepID=A0ABV0EWX0_9ENTE|nr:alpha-mannosidase [Enterococcus sp. 665A]MBO1341768.1 alpha-mannosidase [Enterococcus sp. 665A]